MTEIYTEHDKELRGKVTIKFGPEANLLQPSNPIEIKLQFPPKVMSDGKKSDFKDRGRASYEPIRTWDGAAARRVGIEIKYVVSGAEWSAAKIRDYTREFKRIHYGKIGLRAAMHVMEIRLYDIIGDAKGGDGGPGKFIVMDTDVKYGTSYVKQGDVIWPKLTTISLSCELVTQIGVAGEIEKVKIGNLSKIAKPEWY